MAAGNRLVPNELFCISVLHSCAHRAAREADVMTELLWYQVCALHQCVTHTLVLLFRETATPSFVLSGFCVSVCFDFLLWPTAVSTVGAFVIFSLFFQLFLLLSLFFTSQLYQSWNMFILINVFSYVYMPKPATCILYNRVLQKQNNTFAPFCVFVLSSAPNWY